jgi:hypothetical protein
MQQVPTSLAFFSSHVYSLTLAGILRFFDHLKARNMVREISLDDLLSELKRRELSLADLAQVIKWFTKPQVFKSHPPVVIATNT